MDTFKPPTVQKNDIEFVLKVSTISGASDEVILKHVTACSWQISKHNPGSAKKQEEGGKGIGWMVERQVSVSVLPYTTPSFYFCCLWKADQP